MFVKSRSNW